MTERLSKLVSRVIRGKPEEPSRHSHSRHRYSRLDDKYDDRYTSPDASRNSERYARPRYGERGPWAGDRAEMTRGTDDRRKSGNGKGQERTHPRHHRRESTRSHQQDRVPDDHESDARYYEQPRRPRQDMVRPGTDTRHSYYAHRTESTGHPDDSPPGSQGEDYQAEEVYERLRRYTPRPYDYDGRPIKPLFRSHTAPATLDSLPIRTTLERRVGKEETNLGDGARVLEVPDAGYVDIMPKAIWTCEDIDQQLAEEIAFTDLGSVARESAFKPSES
jgi:hypothetical protein